MTKREQVIQRIRKYAGAFDNGDWTYRTDFDERMVRNIVYTDDIKQNKIRTRILRALYWIFNARTLRKMGEDGVGARLSMAIYSLKRQRTTPDGTLNRGTIIALWQEDGLVIEMMQPSVALLIADFLEQDPDNIHAKRITREIDRVVNTPWKKTK